MSNNKSKQYFKTTPNPKLSVEKAIRKLILAFDLKTNDKIRVFYTWDEERLPRFDDNNRPKYNFYMVDYKPEIREWYISYITTAMDLYTGTIDDITGTISVNKTKL